MKTIPVFLLAASLAVTARAENVNLTNPLKAPAVVEFAAAPGRSVQPGEALLVLDTGAILDKLREAETRRKAAEDEIKANRDKIAPAEAAGATAVAAAAYEAAQAERAFNRYKEGDARASELNLKLNVIEAESALDRQQERYNARDKLLADGYIQKIEYEKEAVLLTKAQYTLESAKIKLDSFLKYERDQMTEQLSRVLEAKKQALANAQALAARGVETAKAAVEGSQKKLQGINEECERIRGLLKNTVLYAPAAGVFTPGDPAHPELKIEPGASLRPAAVVGVLHKP